MKNENSFNDSIYYLQKQREQIEKDAKNLFKDVAKAFMEKYHTNQIEFDSDDCPPFIFIHLMDEDDVEDCLIYKLVFDEDGEIKNVDGHLPNKDEDVFDEPFDSFFDVDYLDLAEYVNNQIENGQYVEKY